LSTAVPDRNYPALFLSLDEALQSLFDGHSAEDALGSAFEGAADGFAAEKALVLLVEEGGSGLRAIAARGLAPEEVAACEEGLSVPGVSSSCVRQALVERTPVLVQDPQRLLGGALASEALRHRPCSVLCAPVLDPKTGAVTAILYFQSRGIRDAFGEIDLSWIEVYARSLGRAMAAARPAASTRA
jgi:hypothetical protein